MKKQFPSLCHHNCKTEVRVSDIHTLTWGAKHCLVISEVEGRMQGALSLEKENGRQLILFLFPPGMRMETIIDAWEAQKKDWITIFECKEPVFVATRVIRLDEEWVVMWNLVHYDQAPHDTCHLVRMNMDTWKYGKVIASATST